MPTSTIASNASIIADASSKKHQHRFRAIKNIQQVQDPMLFPVLAGLAESDPRDANKMAAINVMLDIMNAQDDAYIFEKELSELLTHPKNPANPHQKLSHRVKVEILDTIQKAINMGKQSTGESFNDPGSFYPLALNHSLDDRKECDQLTRTYALDQIERILKKNPTYKGFDGALQQTEQHDSVLTVRGKARRICNDVMVARLQSTLPQRKTLSLNGKQQKKPPSIVETFQQQNINFRTDDNLDPQECLRKPEIDVVEEFQTSLKKTASDDQGRIAVNAELNGSPITIMFKNFVYKKYFFG